jgi:hypothetical protein
MWHRSYWEEFHRLRRVKIARDTFTLDVLCCISLLLFFTKNWRLRTSVILCAESLSYLFCTSNHQQLLFFSSLFKFIFVSEVHWRGYTICVSKNDSRRATDSFAISVFPSVCPDIEPHGKPGFVWNFKWRGWGFRWKYIDQLTFVRIGQN